MKVGRDSSCDLVLNEIVFTGSTDEDLQLVKVSRVQFQLQRTGSNVVMEDMSMNGTYVNGLKLVKGKQHSVDQGDMISILQTDFKVFLFISEVRLRQIYPHSVAKKYLVGRVLGEGSSAVVKEAFERSTYHQVAVKIIKKERWPRNYSKPDCNFKEVDIPLHIEHPCVTRVLEVFDEPTVFAIVMEYAPGGELFDQVVKESEKDTVLNEMTAKLRFYQICHTIAHLHQRNVCHRDLKLENILLMSNAPDSLIKITDFGLSKQFNSVEMLETFVGTPVYMAPEIFALTGNVFDRQSYTCKSDCWSLGVVLYLLLSGTQPFRDSDAEVLKQKIMTGQYQEMTGVRWDAISEDAKNLVSKLLVVDPGSRLSAEKILQHRWFSADMVTVNQARQVMGLDNSEEGDSGKGRSIGNENGDSGKRKRDDAGKGTGAVFAKKKCFNQ